MVFLLTMYVDTDLANDEIDNSSESKYYNCCSYV